MRVRRSEEFSVRREGHGINGAAVTKANGAQTSDCLTRYRIAKLVGVWRPVTVLATMRLVLGNRFFPYRGDRCSFWPLGLDLVSDQARTRPDKTHG
jgi:hypothetical protein